MTATPNEIKVGPHGFVRLVDSMGDDDAIVRAARVSYAGASKKRSDHQLIRYLMRHRHTTPFEMVVLKFHVKAPIFVERQLFRHRMASINSVSGRYSQLPEEFYAPEHFASQDTVNRQGSAEPLPPGPDAFCHGLLEDSQIRDYVIYQQLLEKGVSKEQARYILPVSIYTEWYWKLDLHNLFHMLGLRLDAHAQAETREYAQAIAKLTKLIAPVAYDAFEDYMLDAKTFSGPEVAVLQSLIADAGLTAEKIEGIYFLPRTSETDDFFKKLGLGADHVRG